MVSTIFNHDGGIECIFRKSKLEALEASGEARGDMM